jgi:phage-related protein
MGNVREIIFYKQYFINFYVEQPAKVQQKIEFVLNIIKQLKIIPKKFLKHIPNSEGLYEIRIEYESNIYRVFCCFDQGNIVVLFNSFQKKTQKTPIKEINLALSILKEYRNSK